MLVFAGKRQNQKKAGLCPNGLYFYDPPQVCVVLTRYDGLVEKETRTGLLFGYCSSLIRPSLWRKKPEMDLAAQRGDGGTRARGP